MMNIKRVFVGFGVCVGLMAGALPPPAFVTRPVRLMPQ